MKLVLLSGGSGKRLWPISNDARSKQFLKVLSDGTGGLESMVQRIWRQLGEANLQDSAYVATSRAQVEILHTQIDSSLPLIVEPERRDTFPAIALAATYLYSIASVSLNEIIVVMPVDPYVESSFFDAIEELENVIRHSGADIALMGVKPTYPSEKYGYIVPEMNNSALFLAVKSFQEKPSRTHAEELIDKGALWNCGVFAFKLDYLINLLIAKGLPIRYEAMVNSYDKLDAISFDYEVVEQAERIAVLPYEGQWKDLGTWNTLTEEIPYSVLGKGTVSEDSINTHLINELDIPVTILGLSNIVVATSPDGILVADKSASPRIKDIMKASDLRPMYEERRWGRYRVIDFCKYDVDHEVLTKRICIQSGKNLSYQMHMKRSEVWTIVAGVGVAVINERMQQVAPGDVLQIPRGSRHSIKAITDLDIIEVQQGSELVEEDIVRFTLSWKEIEQNAIHN
jgi:mannose-1-phosphate guanylyltransferase